MKKRVMARICKILDTVNEAHQLIYRSLDTGQISDAAVYLGICEEAAAAVAANIDKLEGKGSLPVSMLGEYRRLLGRIQAALPGGSINPAGIYSDLDEAYARVSKSILHDIKVQKEIVFLPYKASMWDSLESVWRAAAAAPDCDVSVIPIPYYDKNADGSFREFHYEGAKFPIDVPIVHYNQYSFEENRPDMVFIHNPYDGGNYITTVHPFFYSKNLKKYTDKLVYIPYFTLMDPDPNDPAALEEIKLFAQTSAVVNADVAIVQSENMRLCYIEAMAQWAGEKTRGYWGRKIWGMGSPKYDKVAGTALKDVDIPDRWRETITKADGSLKTIVLYNTAVAALLARSDIALEKIACVLKIFETVQDDVALLWRPHPLMEATINSMRPELQEKYQAIVDGYKASGWGIYDDTAEFNRAIALADCYYGDGSSAVELCQRAGIPIMIQNPRVLSE